MPETWKRLETWLMLLATGIAMSMAVGLVDPSAVAGKIALVVSGLLNALGIKASSTSVTTAYLTPAPGQIPIGNASAVSDLSAQPASRSGMSKETP